MPIYEYHCRECGYNKDILQKVSDPLLTRCPSCGAESFSKKVSAPGFQLKGTGWYETDFKNSSGAAGNAGSGGSSADKSTTASDSGTTSTSTEKTTSSVPAGDGAGSSAPAA